jgi:hypothetical protein
VSYGMRRGKSVFWVVSCIGVRNGLVVADSKSHTSRVRTQRGKALACCRELSVKEQIPVVIRTFSGTLASTPRSQVSFLRASLCSIVFS